MITDRKTKILKYIGDNNPILLSEVIKFFWEKGLIESDLKELIREGQVYTAWNSSDTYYFIKESEEDSFEENPVLENEIIENNFVFFGADGVLSFWIEWFNLWCKKKRLNAINESEKYLKMLEKYNNRKNDNGLVDSMSKMKNGFDEVYLDEVYCIDFYDIKKYGKTLLWNLMFYGKQTWKNDLAGKIVELIKEPTERLIKEKNIDGYGFIPPSIDRKVQLTDLLKEGLDIKLPELKPVKIFKDTPVSQKSLEDRYDRIMNARSTIYITQRDFRVDTILLMDDAIWSGSTLNETAKKIKDMGIAKRVIWLGIVWSDEGFEVLDEV